MPEEKGLNPELRGAGTVLDEAQLSRRGFLSGSGKLVGGGALALTLGGTALAAAPELAVAKTANIDLKILNYALTLEHLEATFYRQGLRKFSKQDFRLAFLQYRRYERSGIRILDGEKVYDYFKLIRDHEETHVKTLIAVIKSLGGKPVPACTYDFGYKDVKGFVQVARILENTGVEAYDGAIAYVKNPKLQTAGATIATVEARHASYLNLLNGVVPFPSAFDTPKAPREICQLVDKAFIVKCPFDLKAFCRSLPDKVIAP